MSNDRSGNCCPIIISFLLILLPLISIILLSFGIHFGQSDSHMISDLANNVQSTGISKIFVSNEGICPADSSPLFNLMFPGVKDYCLCEDYKEQVYKFEHLHRNSCKSWENVYCQKSTLKSNVFRNYRGQVLCKKNFEFKYESYLQVDKVDDCPSNMHPCGRDRSKILCLSKQYSCPINYLKITHNKLDAKNIPGAEIINLGHQHYLVYSHEYIDHEIMVEFDWAYSNKCINPTEIIENTGKLDFLKNSNSFVNECSTFYGEGIDHRWNLVDKYNVYDFFAENSPIFEKLGISEITRPEHLDIPLALRSRGYIHFNNQCKPEQNLSLQENLEKMSLLNDSHHNSFYGLLIASLVISCILFIFSIIYCCSGINNIPSKALHILYIIFTIFLIIFLVVISITFSQVHKLAKLSKDLSSEKCVDSETASQFKFAWKRRMFFWGMLGLILSICILSLLIFVCHRCFCWFKIVKSDRFFGHFPMELLDDSVRYSNASSMKYPFEKEGIRNTVSDDPWGLNNFSERGSDYNYWDTPDQKVNEFNYSFNK